MKLSWSEHALLVSMAVFVAAIPNSVVAFVPTCPNWQFQRKGMSPSTPTKLNYIDADKLEIESLMESRRARHSAKKAVEQWKNKVTLQVSLLVGRFTSFLVSRLSEILQLLKKRSMETMKSVAMVKADEAAPTGIPLEDESPIPDGTQGATVFDSVRTNTAASTIQVVDTVQVNGWSLPTLDRAKDEVTDKDQMMNEGTLAVRPELVVVSNVEMIVDDEPTTSKSTPKDPSHLFFACPVATESIVKDSQVDDLQSRDTLGSLVPTVVESATSTMEEEVAAREAKSFFSRMDSSPAPAGKVVQAMEVARGAYQWGSLLTSATTAACGSAFAMAREYAATVAQSKSRDVVPSFVPSPPKFPPSASILDMQRSIPEQLFSSTTKIPFIGTFNIDFEAIDKVLMEAESALKVVEELVASSSSSSSNQQPIESRSKSSSSSSIGTNMDFSEMDDILMQAESALQLAEASLSESDAVQVSTTTDKKESSPSIGTNIDFSEIDQILMQAESALQLAEASCV